jgi:hypothetical protein
VSTRLFMRALAVYYALALGAVWLIAPRSGLGHDHSVYAVFGARALGADLVVVGIMNWLISAESTRLVRRALWANALLNLAPVIMGAIYVLDGSFTSTGWVGVGAHAIPLIGILFCLAFATSARGRRGSAAQMPAEIAVGWGGQQVRKGAQGE